MDDDVAAMIELGLHHEQQHQELLLMDIKHVLSVNPLDAPYRPWAGTLERDGAPLTWTAHDGGLVEIGHAGAGFAFDNEMPLHPIHLAPFELASRPVTNGEWLDFIDDGGYRRADLWLSDGWASVQSEGWDAPLYWCDDDGTWSSFTLAGRMAIEPNAPVCHVSYYEADAYARWAGARLPSEGEWEHAILADGPLRDRFELEALHPQPTPGGLSASTGEVWEWTSSAYLPYPGYRPAPGAVGEYNGKFMVNQHVLRGGACVTPPGHARATYRNFFPPAARWPFTGLRLARDL
jgi:ergothioneine biosynthesis protein EgtB